MRRRTALCVLLAVCFAIFPALGEEGFTAEAELKGFSGFVEEESSMIVTGDITSKQPIRSVHAEMYDKRALETESEYDWHSEGGDEYSVSAYTIFRHLLRSVTPGEKHISVTAFGDNGSCTLLDNDVYFAGDAKPAANITNDCEITCNDDRPWIWTDQKLWSGWESGGPSDLLQIELPDGKKGEGLTVIWQSAPERAMITFYNRYGRILGSIQQSESFCPINAYYDMPSGTASLTIMAPKGTFIEELFIYEKGKVSEVVEKWEKTPEKMDIMLISTHQDDEHLFFGALIEKYSGSKDVGVLYMADCGHDRYLEALDGLWSAGLRTYPVFMGYLDAIPGGRRGAYSRWGGKEAVVESIVEQLRKYRPEVVLTHDLAGEYGHYQHIITAESVIEAVKAAGDPSMYPESAEKYGAWQVKKLYIHLYGENVVKFDWNAPLEGYSGMTGLEVVHMCYNKHRSQQKFVSFRLAALYTCEEFGLYYSAVGADKLHNDLFENLE